MSAPRDIPCPGQHLQGCSEMGYYHIDGGASSNEPRFHNSNQEFGFTSTDQDSYQCPGQAGYTQTQYKPNSGGNASFGCSSGVDQQGFQSGQFLKTEYVEPQNGCNQMVATETHSDADRGSTDSEGSGNGGPRRIQRSRDQGMHKQSQIASTLTWLTDNYERCEGVCLPRCVLYSHYQDFCKKMAYTPAGAATFGKIIRQRFPKLTTRRLGTRGQSKYHYYGIGIKETSIYYHAVYTGKGLTRFSGTKVKTEGSSRKYSLSSKTGTLLPEFPSAETLILPEGVDRDKVRTFLMMYRTHCQRILDTIVSANFDEVQNFLLHFWQGMPEHLVALLSEDFICDVIGLCDAILYKVLVDVLIPSTIQDIPESLAAEIKQFIRKFPRWLCSSLEEVSTTILNKKKEVLTVLISSLRRQMSFINLAQTARPVLACTDTVTRMVKELNTVQLDRICVQTRFAAPAMSARDRKTVKECFTEFKSLLNKQAGVEAITEWLDNVIDTCVLQPCRKDSEVRQRSAEFLLQWTVVGSLVMRDMTLSGANSFGALHLMHIMCDEYVFLVMETQSHLTRERALQAAIRARQIDNVEDFPMNRERQVIHKTLTGPAPHMVKSKKRKLDEVEPDTNAMTCVKAIKKRQDCDKTTSPDALIHSTAFSRIEPTSKDPYSAYPSSTLPTYLSPAPMSPVKPHQMTSQSYYSHIGYPDYHSQRITDSLTSGFNMAANTRGPPYWNHDGRSQYDHNAYTGYPYCNKLSTSTYEAYGSSTLLNRNFGQENYGRSPFDAARSYYSRNQDNYGSLSNHYAEYNGSHPPSSHVQYGRQDAIFPVAQEDFCSGGLSAAAYGHSLTKSLVAQFR